MKEQLSEEEIAKLFEFVKSKYVHYIDVQYEIVDHLASAIEEKQKDSPSISFDRALSEVYGKFPITGFAQLVEEKSKALNKYWTKKFFNFMLNYLKLPKIIIAGFLIYIIQLILRTGVVNNAWILYAICLAFVAGCATYRYFYGFEFNKDFRDKYLVTKTYLSLYAGISSVYLYFPFYMNVDGSSGSIRSLMMATYLTIVILWVHSYTFEFPKMLKNELEEKYGHLKIKLA